MARTRRGPCPSRARANQPPAPTGRPWPATAVCGRARMITLALDASTYAGSVAVLDDARVLAEADAAMKGAHEERLMPAVAGALGRAGIAPARIERIVC